MTVPRYTPAATIDLNAAMPQSHSAMTPLRQCPRAKYWQKKSLMVYLCCLFFCLIINLPFAIVIGVIIRDNDLHHNSECHPYKVTVMVLYCISFFLNLLVLFIYAFL
eukprot:Awhi_evm2s495